MISVKSETVWNRRPALVGLRLRSGIVSLPSKIGMVWPAARVTMARLVSGALAEGRLLAVALALARPVERVDLDHVDAEDRLDRLADLDLVGVGGDDEGVDALVEQGVGLLRHDRPEDDVTWVGDATQLGASSLGGVGLSSSAVGLRPRLAAAGLGVAAPPAGASAHRGRALRPARASARFGQPPRVGGRVRRDRSRRGRRRRAGSPG